MVARPNETARPAAETGRKSPTASFEPGPASARSVEPTPPTLRQKDVWGVAPLHPWVSREEQSRALKAVLERVAELARHGKKALVQVDLDLTALMPVERTVAALKSVGRKLGVPELENARSLPMLPGYTTGAFDTFLRETGLREKYPHLEWGETGSSERAGTRYSRTSLYSQFREAYWYGGGSRETGYVGLETDAATPGLADFVRRVREAGGEVVFNSGRGEQAETGTLEALRRAGIDSPHLLIGARPGMDGGQVKALRQAQLSELGRTVAVIDDRKRNREDLSAEAPDALFIAVAVPGFTAESATREADWRISTFEW